MKSRGGGAGPVLGYSALDQQHSHLTELAKQLAAALDADPVGDDWERTAKALIDQTARHFEYEEWLMEHSDYPAWQGHRAQHVELLAQLNQFVAQQAADATQRPANSTTLASLLQRLLGHMNEGDRNLADWLRGYRIALSASGRRGAKPKP